MSVAEGACEGTSVERVCHPLATTGVLIAGLVVVTAQGTPTKQPAVRLVPAPFLSLPGDADSNSPAVWERIDGTPTLVVLTSVAGQPSRAIGPRLSALGEETPVDFSVRPAHGVWMEAVLPDVDGTWYGYYHNEIPAVDLCGDPSRVVPRIGAARSTDFGATWEDLGVILEAPPRTHTCESQNQYFLGGVGDFSAILDRESQDVYFFYSQYVRREWGQGVALARMAWADRDEPVGKLASWTHGVWLPARASRMADAGEDSWVYPVASPIYPVAESWHLDGPAVDAFWGPSVHWNTHLQQYVMLLNRSKDMQWSQEGIYVAFSPSLEDPSLWATPRQILNGGGWYPQVFGLEPGAGTDRLAGAVARLFIHGRSEYLIQFTR
jgi:hypothetical protein